MDAAANSSSSSLYYLHRCYDAPVGLALSAAFFLVHLFLILPLSLFILHLGLQRWRQRRSFGATCHSDAFTYHWAAMELILGLGFVTYVCGRYFGVTGLVTVGFYATSNFYYGPISFHALTCLERHLAVVHPVAYLGLRQSGGVRVRNVGIGCAWTLYLAWFGFQMLYGAEVPYLPVFFLVVLSLIVVSFCSLSVLRALIRPGPGEVGRPRERVDQSKRRAFHTIAAITAVLWLLFLGLLLGVAVDRSRLLGDGDACAALASTTWFTVPGSLVLPLLFLHRAGKLPSCPCNRGQRLLC